jgi:hypothetical protein
MAAFKAEPLSVKKDQEVGYGNTSYTHASLAAVVDAVVAALSKHGLSHRWETKQDGEQITVSCIITHELGHCEHTTLSAGPDKSGSKNAIQAVGSTVTYLQRYTLMAATGLAAHEMDDDARGASPAETLSAAMIEQIEKLIVEVKADRPKFLKWAKAESIEAIPAKSYAACVRMLEKKRKQ